MVGSGRQLSPVPAAAGMNRPQFGPSPFLVVELVELSGMLPEAPMVEPPQRDIEPPDMPEQAESKAMTAAIEMSLNILDFFHKGGLDPAAAEGRQKRGALVSIRSRTASDLSDPAPFACRTQSNMSGCVATS